MFASQPYNRDEDHEVVIFAVDDLIWCIRHVPLLVRIYHLPISNLNEPAISSTSRTFISYHTSVVVIAQFGPYIHFFSDRS